MAAEVVLLLDISAERVLRAERSLLPDRKKPESQSQVIWTQVQVP